MIKIIKLHLRSLDKTEIEITTKSRKQKWEEKQLYRYFKQQTKEIAYKMICSWLRRGNLKRETGSLLIVAQNNVLSTNYIKAKLIIFNRRVNLGYVETVMKQLFT